MRMRSIAARLCAAALLLCSRAAAAEELDLPLGTGPVPVLGESAKTGVVVGQSNISRYRRLLPAEVAERVSKGDLTFEAAAKSLPKPARAGGRQDAAERLAVDARGCLPAVPGDVRGPLFSAESLQSSGASPQEQGFKVLWNSSSVAWAAKSFTQSLRLAVFDDERSEGRVISLVHKRMYPGAFEAPGSPSAVIFRDKVEITAPLPLASLAWLSFRLAGAGADDYVWIASPLVKKVRQVVGSSRSDDVIPDGFSADDLLVWSGKVDAASPLRASRQVMLVPVLDTVISEKGPENGGCADFPDAKGMVRLNGESQRFPQYPGWIPTNVRFYPRQVWRVDFAVSNPFYREALISLYVDEETHLPVYRVSWGHDGRQRKVILGAIGFFGARGDVVPWIVAQLAWQANGKAHSTLVTEGLSLCLGHPARPTEDSFDPSALAFGAEGPAARNEALKRPAEASARSAPEPRDAD